MPDDILLQAPTSTGEIIATDQIGTSSGSHYQYVKLAGGTLGSTALIPGTTGGLAVLSTGTFTVVSASSGLVQISGTPTVTSTQATNPWSSAPGFNIPIVSVSSGLVQISGTPTVTATGPVTVTSGTVTLSSQHTVALSSAGFGPSYLGTVSTAGFSPVTSSGGLLVNVSSGTVSLSSQITVTATGPVTITSGTVTSTAATNPWSSAPGFNLPLVSASSGLIQISGTVTVLSASSGLVQISGTPTVTSTAATNPWSSAPGFNVPIVSVSSGLVQISGTVTVLSASSGLVQISGTPTVLSASSGLIQISGTPFVNVVGTSSAIATVTSSGGLAVSIVAGAGAGSTQVHIVGAANVQAPVTSSFGLLTQVSSGSLIGLSSGTVTLSSVHTVTATAATNPWSSAPGFNLIVTSASSGLVQISGTPTVTATGPVTITSGTVTLSSQHTVTAAGNVTTSQPEYAAGVQLVTLTTAGHLRVTSTALTQPISFTSGTVTLSSVHTVTATAGTNPWSSAPGFNLQIVSVSSGLVQISGTVTVLSASSGLIQISGTPTVISTAATNPWSSAPGFNVPIVSVSSGLVQISGTPTVTATAATNPWSSAPGFNVPIVSVSSGFVRSFGLGAVTTSGLTAAHKMSTGGAVATNITTAPSALYGYAIFNSTATPQAVKYYNSTNPTVGGSTANLLLTVGIPGSTGGGGANLMFPVGVYSSNGWSYIITANLGDTDTGAPGTNNISCGTFYQI